MLVDHSDSDDDSSDAELSDEDETTHNVSANKNPWMSSSKLLLLSLSETVAYHVTSWYRIRMCHISLLTRIFLL